MIASPAGDGSRSHGSSDADVLHTAVAPLAQRRGPRHIPLYGAVGPAHRSDAGGSGIQGQVRGRPAPWITYSMTLRQRTPSPPVLYLRFTFHSTWQAPAE